MRHKLDEDYGLETNIPECVRFTSRQEPVVVCCVASPPPDVAVENIWVVDIRKSESKATGALRKLLSRDYYADAPTFSRWREFAIDTIPTTDATVAH